MRWAGLIVMLFGCGTTRVPVHSEPERSETVATQRAQRTERPEDTQAAQATSFDAGADGGTDAGADAGIDAGVDAGRSLPSVPPLANTVGPEGLPLLLGEIDAAQCQPGARRRATQTGECSTERGCTRPGPRRPYGASCYAPGSFPSGGARMPTHQILGRDACGPDEVAALLPSARNFVQVCRPDCRRQGCPSASVCFSDGLCRRDCTTHGCGPNTTCTDGGDGWSYCRRASCRRTRDCECGTCIGEPGRPGGLCFDGPGTCQSNAPRP